jgi:hypothetical protein
MRYYFAIKKNESTVAKVKTNDITFEKLFCTEK